MLLSGIKMRTSILSHSAKTLQSILPVWRFCNVSHSDVADHARKIPDSRRAILPAYDVSKSPWEAMTGKSLEIMVEVLEAFKRAIKVNAYDDIRVADFILVQALFDPCSCYSDHAQTLTDQTRKMDEELMSIDCNNHLDDIACRNEINMIANKEHRITILNQPEDVADLLKYKARIRLQICRPKLPLMNGDCTVNELVYKGPARRVLSIAMQNPGILESQKQHEEMKRPVALAELLHFVATLRRGLGNGCVEEAAVDDGRHRIPVRRAQVPSVSAERRVRKKTGKREKGEENV
ncbi:unnamed protein product [Fraxinus pennsylvanica]|uniref:Uncharacterized protein n=1 Tax=Fraxinus pennsylvanica TaxID=56036 RepID=A0AAD2DK90_9LAMI|nr:unnamed protein product [Fraxinus pennsylvanica]